MSEQSSVQSPILQYAQKIGWKIVKQADAEVFRGFGATLTVPKERAKGASLFFDDLLYAKVKEFNPLYPESKDALVKQLGVFQSDIQGNRIFWSYLRGERTFFLEKENRELNLKLIDFDNPDNNEYQVTEEYYFYNGHYANREDIVFLINGIPVVVVECKNPTKDEAIAIGIDQIRRYQDETPEMLIPQQVFSVTEALGFSYGVTWNLNRRSIFNWKNEETGNLEQKAKTFFNREHILDFIKNFIVFVEKDGELNKYILAQHQVDAVALTVQRAHDDQKHRGLVWHTQGSGKTFTMIKAAEVLFKHSKSEKPTILMLIDRNELEDQMMRNLKAVGVGNVEVAGSISGLNQLLKDDYRGIIVCMIHKFRDMPANISLRKNIYVLIDEAHRTTQGDLGNYLMAAVPNASYIGFTGTPIDKTAYGKGTFKTFGVCDPKGYLHKYSIADSIEDGTTLPLFYSLAPNDMLVDGEVLEKEFLSLAEAQGVSDIDELNKILEKAVNIRNFLKGEKRVDKVAKFVAEHFTNVVEPLGYKAFLVGVDREACALYKKALDKYLPSEYSTVVYTGNHNDQQNLKAFHLTEDKEKEIRKAFPKKDTLPKILIVTEKLLTGYDAPILYAMYLDKPMRDHTLLQATARVNRPYVDESTEIKKPHGFVLDFVGIFDKLEKALAFDSKDVSAVIKNIDVLKNLFKAEMENTAPQYLQLVDVHITDKEVDKLIEHFKDKSARKKFFEFYKKMELLYEIVSPDAFLRPFLKDYGRLTEIYAIVRNAFAPKIMLDRELLRKTCKLVQKEVDIDNPQFGFEQHKVDKEVLEKIKAKNVSGNIKVINLIKSIQKYVEDNPEDVSLIPLAVRAQAVKEHYEERQETTQKVLDELFSIWDDELKRKQEQKERGIDALTSFVESVLEKFNVAEPQKTSKDVRAAFESCPNWKQSDEELRDLRKEVHLVLLAMGLEVDESAEVVDEMFEQLEKVRSR